MHPSRWPGGGFGQLGGALEAEGTAVRTTWGPESKPISKVFLAHRSKGGVFFSCLFPGSFERLSGLNLLVWSLKTKHLMCVGLQKSTFHRRRNFVNFRFASCVFFGLGINFHDFWCLGKKA